MRPLSFVPRCFSSNVPCTLTVERFVFEGDIPFNVSGILDMNSITCVPEIATLQALANTQMKAQNRPSITSAGDTTTNVVTGSRILSDFHDPTYFTSAFPTVFPYGTGKHIDPRCAKELDLSTWVELLLKHSSRFAHLSDVLTMF
jgi:hypothetical protein